MLMNIMLFLLQALVTAFGVSRYASTRKRGQGKPFNPLEGETYEYVRNDLGWRFIAEQVYSEIRFYKIK